MNKINGILHNSELGKMKDEIPNDTIMEACFFKAKAYCFITVKKEEKKKIKGITKATIKNQINVEDYNNAICEGKIKYVSNYTIDSNRHHLETKEQYKIATDPIHLMIKVLEIVMATLGFINEGAPQIIKLFYYYFSESSKNNKRKIN